MSSNKPTLSFIDQVTIKKLDRYAAWIVIALAGIYLVTFPIHKSPILVVIPVAAAGWFYKVRGGLIAGLAAIILDLFLVNIFKERIVWGQFWAEEGKNFFLIGHFFMFIASVSVGRLREMLENYVNIERDLRASEERFRSLYENATIGIYSTTPEGQILLANPALIRMLGYESFAELTARNLEKEGFAAQSPRGEFQRDIEESGVITGLKSVWVKKDGSVIFVRESARAIRDDQGHILRYEGVVEDITEREQAEEELREREARLAAIFNNSADAIITIDKDRNILSFSKSAEQTFGYVKDEVVGKPLDMLLPARYAEVHPEHITSFANSTDDFRIKDKRLEIVGLRKNGVEFPAEATISKLNIKGRLNLAVFMRDITERKQAEKELNSHTRFLALLNEMTHSIIASTDFNVMLGILANNVAKLLEADSCYITRWDPIREQVFPAASIGERTEFFMKMEYPKEKRNLTISTLEAGQILVAENTPDTPYTIPAIIQQYPEKMFLCIPLVYGTQRLGAVFGGFNEQHQFTQAEMERAKQAGEQIALAVWNAQQEIELQRSLREAKALADIAQALSETESIGFNRVLDLIVNSAKDLIANAEQAVIHLLDEKEQMLVSEAVAGFSDLEGGKRNMHVGKGVAGQVMLSGETINITDVNTDPRFIMMGSAPTYRSLLVAPVRSGEQKLGTISIQSSQAYAFTPNDVKLLSQLGTHAAIAIENANLLEGIQQSLKESNALYRINQGLVASLEPDDLLQDTVELLQKNFDYHYVQIFVADPDTGNFIMRAGSGRIGAQLKARKHQLAAGEGIVGYTAETGTAFFTNNVDDAVSFVRNPLLPDIRSELAVPVKSGREILGLLDIQQVPPRYLSQRDLQLVSTVADQLAVALQKADLYESLQVSLQQEKAIRNQLMQNERLTVMGRLLATVSHELNNPLQAIQNALFLLKEETGLSSQGKLDLSIVLAEAERMAGMIERLRDTYRPIQADDFQPTQINDIVEDVYALVSTHLRHNQIAFEFHPDTALSEIPALSDQIRQVVLNLIMNAVEAMPDGGKINVSTQLLQDANEVLLTIADNGPGIPPHILPTIFEAFVTSKPSGTGLGLTISYDIVLKHRGRIVAENNPERGAIFKVWLPTNNGEIL